MFGSILTPAKIIIAIRTGDKLIRDDAVTFLRDHDSNDTEFADYMFNVLICYVANASPEVPRLCKKLDNVVRQMFQIGLLARVGLTAAWTSLRTATNALRILLMLYGSYGSLNP